MTMLADADTHQRRIAAEIIELGEALFDAVLDTAAERSEPLPEAELRTAAEEFFQTLRVMLEVADPPVPAAGTGRGQEGG
jgi:hypothetical protein